MKLLSILLSGLILLLLFRLLSSDGGLGEYFELKQQLTQLEADNQSLAEQNELLSQEVWDLQNHTTAIETIARQKLGMIKQNEVFIQVIELPHALPNLPDPALVQDPNASSFQFDLSDAPLSAPVAPDLEASNLE